MLLPGLPLKILLVGAVAVVAAGCGSSNHGPTLFGLVNTKGVSTLKDKSGRIVTEVKAGPYTLVLDDTSTSRAFNIRGGKLNLKTSEHGTTSLTFHVTLVSGTYSYWSDPKGAAKRTFTVR